MTRLAIEAAFIDGPAGKILVTARFPSIGTGESVLIVPPFAEEMNKTRKMISDVARGLASRGIATVLPDLYGTGDSAGDFSDANWDIWKGDIARAAAWGARQGWPVSGLLCVRTGCALGAEATRGEVSGIRRTVFWQPVLDGRRYLTQFLRLRVTAAMMQDDRKETTAGLRERLGNGEVLEIAGYALSPVLASQLETSSLREALGPQLGAVSWFETVRGIGPIPSDATRRVIEFATDLGIPIQFSTIVGEAFWSSTEIVRNGELVSQTVARLAGLP